MEYPDLNSATKEELWDYCLIEYESSNPFIKLIINRFYKKINVILANLKLKKESKLLEVGCGAGESSRIISKMLNGQHFEISDNDARYIEKLKELDFSIKIKQETVYSLKRKNGEFDLIFLLEVLEHLEYPERALKELFRVSKGYVIISVPNEPIWSILNFIRGKYWNEFGNTPGHINHWNSRSLKNLVSKYGKVLQVYTPFPWIIILAKVFDRNEIN